MTTNESIRAQLELRDRLEQKILALGGKIPRLLPWDYNGSFRNTQLLELIEDLEAGRNPRFVPPSIENLAKRGA